MRSPQDAYESGGELRECLFKAVDLLDGCVLQHPCEALGGAFLWHEPARNQRILSIQPNCGIQPALHVSSIPLPSRKGIFAWYLWSRRRCVGYWQTRKLVHLRYLITARSTTQILIPKCMMSLLYINQTAFPAD